MKMPQEGSPPPQSTHYFCSALTGEIDLQETVSHAYGAHNPASDLSDAKQSVAAACKRQSHPAVFLNTSESHASQLSSSILFAFAPRTELKWSSRSRHTLFLLVHWRPVNRCAAHRQSSLVSIQAFKRPRRSESPNGVPYIVSDPLIARRVGED